MSKSFVEKLFCVVIQKISVLESIHIKGGGEEGSIKIFRRKYFVSQYRKISLGNPSVLWFIKHLGSKKFDKREGRGTSLKIFRRKFVVSQYRKLRKGTFLCFKKCPVSKSFLD